MKKTLLVVAVAVFVMSLAGGAYAAPLTGDVALTATVAHKCSAITANALNLAIDPATALPITSTGGDTTIQCTSGETGITVSASGRGKADGTSAANASTSVGNTLSGYLADGTNAIPYTLTLTNTFTGAGFGVAATPTTLVAAGGVSVSVAAAQAAVSSALYADTVTLTVTY